MAAEAKVQEALCFLKEAGRLSERRGWESDERGGGSRFGMFAPAPCVWKTEDGNCAAQGEGSGTRQAGQEEGAGKGNICTPFLSTACSAENGGVVEEGRRRFSVHRDGHAGRQGRGAGRGEPPRRDEWCRGEGRSGFALNLGGHRG
ncbi:hypothetical protein NDU88_003133 [Pleurodeles waltl]|uniref:Uncharacterized protein n=1 Tax=Pleurodeles waltl TaxID=8319 RepID=A0AAV7PCX8_PLEWA|nr:hypothetical protein NDU88_003133 [Pleurodeles waltl]